MKKYSLKNGDQIPSLGLGTWKAKKREIYTAIRKAIEIGYRHFDCAFIYENEREIGAALNDAIMMGEINRSEIWVTSKLWNTHHRTEDVIVALEHSLHDFGLDYLDLYLMHWPVAQHRNEIFPSKKEDMISLDKIPLQETWQGMEECVTAGLSKHVGVSNFSINKLKTINSSSIIKVEVNQVELHPLLRQQKLIDFCKKENILVTGYSPLGSRDRKEAFKAPNEPDLFSITEIVSIAKSHNCTPAQILIAWAINRGTIVIPKSTSPERLQLNFQAADIRLSPTEISVINNLDRHFRYVIGDFFCFEGSDYTVQSLWDE